MNLECKVQERATQPTLVMRRRAPVFLLPKVVGETYAAIAKHLAAIGEEASGAPFIAYHNMNMLALDMEIGFPVKRALPGKDKILAGEIPGGRTASCMHVGPYNKVGPAYQALQKFVKDNGQKASGIAYEFYLNDPTTTTPAELRTEVVFPLL